MGNETNVAVLERAPTLAQEDGSKAADTPARRHRRVIVMIPAHNEEAFVADSIECVIAHVDAVYVAADNCTDGTVEAARRAGATVIETVDNHGFRAGALNQVLGVILDDLDDDDVILAMDADTIVDPDLVANTIAHFDRDPSLGAVAANHLVRRSRNVLELLQLMEFERDRRYIGRKQGRVGAMSGMASAFTAKALRDVRDEHGTVYDEHNWTEDWKLTFSLKHAGYRCLRPQDCIARTIPVTEWRKLFLQRERWARGYFQTLTEFGVTRVTAWPWFGQLWGLFNVAVWLMWLVLVAQTSFAHGVRFPAWALAAGAILLVERTVAVRRVGWSAIGISLALVIEMAYTWWLTAATLTGIAKHVFRRDGQWVKVKTVEEVI
jgi:cellulose synthase/poly-beta-1,6-N-acetylglucosamine synthase-like glycosyltransferase